MTRTSGRTGMTLQMMAKARRSRRRVAGHRSGEVRSSGRPSSLQQSCDQLQSAIRRKAILWPTRMPTPCRTRAWARVSLWRSSRHTADVQPCPVPQAALPTQRMSQVSRAPMPRQLMHKLVLRALRCRDGRDAARLVARTAGDQTLQAKTQMQLKAVVPRTLQAKPVRSSRCLGYRLPLEIACVSSCWRAARGALAPLCGLKHRYQRHRAACSWTPAG